MGGRRGPGPTRADPGGAHEVWRPSAGYLAVAILVVVAGGLAVWSMSPSPDALGTDTAPLAPLAASSAALSPGFSATATASAPASASLPFAPVPALSATAPPQVTRMRDPNGDLTPDLADFVNSGERPTMAEVIDRLHAAGVRGGLGAFSPPGTRPPLVGLSVPDDFVLPEGYVRHHQATDDGQRIEPILMFAPEHRLFDAAGRPIALPGNRVVPPELAPAGLPIRRIVIPAPAPSASPGR